MESPSQKILINSSDATLILEECRILKHELLGLIELIKREKKKEKLFGDWIHESEILELTGLSRNTLYNLYKEGKLKKSSISGKSNYYKMSDFKKLLNDNEFR
jgi:predicted DNA-binding transcriptional regulator AlpA